ncbi:anhydro-N-acetylmuramic acid kinase [Silvibacterium dinghuense]|uniref:Anhydro-N-acetylmuramic acid kinase n=2 Tax=Silvibacterium dinghuense TaxID=1560006 RepID=A0A4Q1SEN3_9BACT|nr:anhydro-N-acetylmuramic acid kinase [Silvibacterium dinghuense]
MIVAGIMSGTSADGIDVALVRITPGPSGPRLKLLAHYAERYPARLRAAVLAAMNASAISAAELARLNWRLGLAYADSVTTAVTKYGFRPDLIGCHGQTIYHQGKSEPYLGQHFACTWQIGEASLIAAKSRVPVVSNFRPADMAAGGQGAPLVPFLDYTLFRHPRRARVLQNLGGIANLTVIPRDASPDQILAFDTGPANMIIDALMEQLYAKRFDRNGAVARRGKVLSEVTNTLLRDRYFAAPPPKSCGREEFGADYTTRFLALCKQHSNCPEDAIATATAFTAETIADAWQRFVAPRINGQPVDYIVAGGGAQNPTLMRMLSERLTPLGARVLTIDETGLPAQAKEAAAFALLAWQTWHYLPSNIPAATGASRPAILGQITYA